MAEQDKKESYAGMPSPWEKNRDKWDDFWLDGKIPEQSINLQKFGVTKELSIAWINVMRKPIQEWQEIRWYSVTKEYAREVKLDERRELARKTALATFRNFLQSHPELPTTAIRPLLRNTVSHYHERYGMANPQGRAKAIHEEENLFFDEALRLYREGHLSPVATAVSAQQSETQTAVEKIKPE